MGVSTLCEIGTTSGTLVTLSSLGISAPLTSYQPNSERKRTIDGSLYGRGSALAEWRWPVLTQPEIEALRAYIPNSTSAAITIKTPVNEDRAYDVFDVVAEWPEKETGTAFVLKFSRLVAA